MDQVFSDVVIAIVTALCGYIVWLLKDIRKTAKAKDEREEKVCGSGNCFLKAWRKNRCFWRSWD